MQIIDIFRYLKFDISGNVILLLVELATRDNSFHQQRMGRYPDGPKACLEDPSCHVYIKSMTDLGPIIVYCYWAFVVLLCTAFQILKMRKVRKSPVSPSILRDDSPYNSKMNAETQFSKPHGEEMLLDVENSQELVVTGYTWSYFGEICYCICCLTSVHWMLLFLLILYDTYNKCQVGGIDNLCFYGNNVVFGTYELNGQVFFLVWWLSTVWCTTWVIFKGKVHNWFRIPCVLSEASYVHVWTKDEDEILTTNAFVLVYYMRRLKSIVLPPDSRGHSEIVRISVTRTGQRYFLFEGSRVLVNKSTLSHARVSVGTTFTDFYQSVNGLTAEEARDRLEYVGLNAIPFEPEPLLQSICDEMFTFFHVYQLVMYMLQFWNSYLFVATLMTCIVLLSASITIYTRRRSQFTIAQIAHVKTEADVLRANAWITVDASLIVPGDIVKVKSSWLLPCDLLILQGTCITDESALTGEAMPVQKYSAPETASVYHPEGAGARHTLFSGTTVLQAGSYGQEVRAVATTTGMNTSKGELLSSILYPQSMLFKYDEELPLVALLLVLYGVVCFSISIVFQNHAGAHSYWVTKWIYCMAIVSQILSPLLPVALEVGQLHSVDRLKKRGIFCLNPKRIAIAGKIRVFCFDKTGTLTREGLDFVGVQSVSKKADAPSFGALLSPEKGDNLDPIIMHGLATCHALSKFNDDYVGNQVEVKMFKSAGWELVEDSDQSALVRNDAGKELKIVKRNEFDHSRATMSVIVEEDETFHIYCKGSFEKIQDLSSPSSIPADYQSIARTHALDGCYVLSLGYRKLDSSMTLQAVLKLTRDQVEKDLTFVALVLFRNELKPGTRDAIEALKEGEVRPIMITGDNAQCGHYIAKQCGMVSSQAQVWLGDISDSSVTWMPVKPQTSSTTTTSVSTKELLSENMKSLKDGSIELAITGKAFNLLRKNETMDKLLFFTRIFARFTPADKVKVATMHRDRGLIVGMCGDGGNDCGALRAAHAGIALSEAEASVVSPFTSKDKSVASVVDLLREGRAALHTSFACYKFLIMYGLMFSVLKLCAYWYGIIPCQMDYVFIDGVAVLVLGYAMTLSYPEDKLGKERPTSSLLGPVNVASVLGVWFINLVFLIIAVCLMGNHSEYVKWPSQYSHEASWWTLGDNWESTVLFFTMYFQFISSSIVFTFGATFRKNVMINLLLVGSYAGLVILFTLLLLLPSSSFTSLWHVASEQFNKIHTDSPVWISYQNAGGQPSPGMPFDLRLSVWLVIMGSIICNCFWQKLCVEGFIAQIIGRRYPSTRPIFHL